MTHFVGHHTQAALLRQDPTPKGLLHMHKKQLYADLKSLGAVQYNLRLPETHCLPEIIHLDERLQGIVYGRYKQHPRYGQESKAPSNGRGALVVTDKRVLFIDKKPLFLRCDEVPYDIISGVTYTKAGLIGTVTLRTRAGDFAIRTLNQRCATRFVEAIEAICFEQRKQE